VWRKLADRAPTLGAPSSASRSEPLDIAAKRSPAQTRCALPQSAGDVAGGILNGLTSSVVLAKELGPRKIRVNSINPGMIETEGVHSAGLNEGDFRKWIEAQSPLGRIGQPNDISPTAVYLASSDSKYLTGEIIRVTGGIL